MCVQIQCSRKQQAAGGCNVAKPPAPLFPAHGEPGLQQHGRVRRTSREQQLSTAQLCLPSECSAHSRVWPKCP